MQLEELTIDSSKSTPLHAAALVNYPAGVAALITGAEVAGMGLSTGEAWGLRLDAEGSTALHIAAAEGFSEVVELGKCFTSLFLVQSSKGVETNINLAAVLLIIY